MKRFFYVMLAVLFAATSCGKNGWYISVDYSFWEIKSGQQVGWVSFLDDEHVCTIQKNPANGAWQVMNGTFTVKGHRVDVSADGSSIRMVRTFSNLKNSSNKNYTRLQPEGADDLSGTLWAALKDGNLQFFFLSKGYCQEAWFKNVSHREGFYYGWSWDSKIPYSLSGSSFEAGDAKGQLYRKGAFVALKELSVPCVSTASDKSADSPLAGSLWTYQTGSYPGFILFTSDTDFTRVLVSSTTVFSVLTGTYSLKENSLEFETESKELCQTCAVEDGKFTYLEKTYSLESSF